MSEFVCLFVCLHFCMLLNKHIEKRIRELHKESLPVRHSSDKIETGVVG